MIIETRGSSTYSALDLPSYVGTNTKGDTLLGVGKESAAVARDAWEAFLYRKALGSDCAHARRTEPQAEANESMAAYVEIRTNVQSLSQAPEQDEFGRIRPSEQAIANTFGLVFKIIQSGALLRAAEDISTDHDGAIRILWENDGRTLELVYPFSVEDRPYVYFATGKSYRIANDLSTSRLGRLASWLNGVISDFPK